MDTNQETLPAGTPLERIPLKDGVLFGGWVDENNNPVTVAPEEDCTLYATWGDKLDIKYLKNNSGEIKLEDLIILNKTYQNAVLGYKITPISEKLTYWDFVTYDPWSAIRIYWVPEGENLTTSVFTDSYYLDDLIKMCKKYKNGGIEFRHESLGFVNKNSHFCFSIADLSDSHEYRLDCDEYNSDGEYLGGFYSYIKKDGYILEGVYLDEALTMRCDGDTFTVDKDSKFYLKWDYEEEDITAIITED